MKIFTEKNVRIEAYQSLIMRPPPGSPRHQGGPLWEDWDTASDKRHCINGHPVDTKPSLTCRDLAITTIEHGFWAGPICNHYGHQIAEFSTRIPAYLGLHSSDSPIIFSTFEESTENIPSFFWQILFWYGIPCEHVYIHKNPILVKNLSWSKQQEQLKDIPPSTDLVDKLTIHAQQNLKYPAKKGLKLYVSRSSSKVGVIAGERFLEEFYCSQGFIVLRPENHTLREQLTLYQNSSKIIFSEGSALHSLQLLGKLDCEASVIVRRPGRRLANNILKSRIPALRYAECIRLFVDGLDRMGNLTPDRGITIPCVNALRHELEKTGINARYFSVSDFQASVEDDIRRWFVSQIAKCSSPDQQNIANIRARIGQLDVYI